MLEFLKKIGIPATVAAIIASIITITPFLFKLDERYAKEDDVHAQTVRAEAAMNTMNAELMKLAGTQEVLVAIITKQERRSSYMQRQEAPVTYTPGPVVVPMPAPPVAVGAPKPGVEPSAVKKLEEVTRSVQGQQDRLRSFKY